MGKMVPHQLCGTFGCHLTMTNKKEPKNTAMSVDSKQGL